MSKKNTVIIVSSFLIFVALVIGLICGTIVASPVEVTASTAGNFVGNMMNEGYVLEDETFLFYSNPQDNVLYRAETNHIDEKPVKIAENCNGYLQLVNDVYYFQQGNDLVRCNYEGKNMTTVLSNVNKPLVVGGSIYYLNEAGSIMKYSTKYGTASDLNIKPDGYYTVYFNKIYFTADNLLYTASTDGSDVKVFFEEKVDKFIIDDKYLFYSSSGSNGSSVYSAISQDGEMKSSKIAEANSFYIILSDGMMIYDDGKSVKLANMTSLTEDEKYEPIVLQDKTSAGVFGDDRYFYWFNQEGKLSRVDVNGENKVVFE